VLTSEKKFYVHPTADVSDKAVIGDGTKIWHQAQIREGAVIGSNCIISKCVYIDFNVKIGNNCKVQNFVSVYHGVTVEDDVFLGPSCTLTNDMYPRAVNANWKTVDTLIKKGASVGANATIVCGITLGEYCMVGAGAVVTKDVAPHALVVGNPARAIGYVCKCGTRAKKVEKKGGKITFKCEGCGETITV
jgi:acetyltransferase-like isoleucine patch superfamily enzyme